MERNIEGFKPSELGTLDYWEKTYTLEIENFEDHRDVGEVWFGNGSSPKIIRFISTRLDLSKKSDPIIDLGCGNGMSLVHFAKAGYENLTGIDYSQKAINLARKVVDGEGFPAVTLQVHNIIEPDNENFDFHFKLAHDKGTYDAVSLHPHEPKEKCKRYIRNVHKILADGGFLSLTSCNWTTDELIEQFKDYFQLLHEVPSQTFSFGGQTGSNITQLIFVKK